jgi:hypothetical protein
MLDHLRQKKWNAKLRAWNDLHLELAYRSNGVIATKLLAELKKLIKR